MRPRYLDLTSAVISAQHSVQLLVPLIQDLLLGKMPLIDLVAAGEKAD
jgi:hypothetical protein